MLTITIDGGAGTGKGTTAKSVAKALGYQYIDTGAMYRGVALQVLTDGHDPHDDDQVIASATKLQFGYEYNPMTDTFEVLINGVNQEQHIRTPEVAAIVSTTAQYPAVRQHLIAQQQALGKTGGVVFDGRDGGTVIAPHAQLKVHLICDLDIRARRRQQQYATDGKTVDLETIKNDLYQRDQKDLYGPDATNQIAEDARDLDTTHLTIDQQIDQIVEWAKNLTT